MIHQSLYDQLHANFTAGLGPHPGRVGWWAGDEWYPSPEAYVVLGQEATFIERESASLVTKGASPKAAEESAIRQITKAKESITRGGTTTNWGWIVLALVVLVVLGKKT